MRDGPGVRVVANTTTIPPPLAWPPAPPYNNTVKDLGASPTLGACEAACVRYRNADVAPVSGWWRCQAFTWRDDGTCTGLVDATDWRPRSEHGSTSGRLTWPPTPCASDADCSLNGACDARVRACACDAAWRGDRCQSLALAPARQDSGLRAVDAGRNTSTWGGAVVYAGGEYHMWASEMIQHCGIDSWTTNSRVVHAASTDGVRFERDSVVFPAFSHEPNVVRAPTGEWLMLFTGAPPGSPPPTPCTQCADGRTRAGATCAGGPAGRGPTYLSWSASPTGPWSARERLFAAQANATAGADTNLAVTILANGSAVGIARMGGHVHLVRARHWRDAASYVGEWATPLLPATHGLEDPCAAIAPRSHRDCAPRPTRRVWQVRLRQWAWALPRRLSRAERG